MYIYIFVFQCCGEKTYKLSDKVLCCNGILYNNLTKNSQCVGGFVYTENQTIMTCDSKVNNITKAKCCGTLRMDENQICCSSSSHAMRYEIKLNHHCCGHRYYNKSLWGCCAGDLTPTPKKNSPPKYTLKSLTDLIPHMCNKTGDHLYLNLMCNTV